MGNKKFKHDVCFHVCSFFLGLSAFISLPRESFPEINETNIYISTPYPGNTAEDIERFVTDARGGKRNIKSG